jgi:hypothetical protein
MKRFRLDRKRLFPVRKTKLSFGFLLFILGMMASVSIPGEVLGQAALSKKATPKTAVPVTTAIPVPEIVTRAAEAIDRLRDLTARAAPSPQIDSMKAEQIKRQLPAEILMEERGPYILHAECGVRE